MASVVQRVQRDRAELQFSGRCACLQRAHLPAKTSTTYPPSHNGCLGGKYCAAIGPLVSATPHCGREKTRWRRRHCAILPPDYTAEAGHAAGFGVPRIRGHATSVRARHSHCGAASSFPGKPAGVGITCNLDLPSAHAAHSEQSSHIAGTDRTCHGRLGFLTARFKRCVVSGGLSDYHLRTEFMT